MWILCWAEDSHKMSSLIFSEKQRKMFYECRLLQSWLVLYGLRLQVNPVFLPLLPKITNFSTKYFILSKVYTEEDGIKQLYHGLSTCTGDRPWYNCYISQALAWLLQTWMLYETRCCRLVMFFCHYYKRTQLWLSVFFLGRQSPTEGANSFLQKLTHTEKEANKSKHQIPVG